MFAKTKIAIIGPGVMGTAILSSLVSSGKFNKENICASGPEVGIIKSLQEKFGVAAFTENAKAVEDADVVLLTVKPQKFDLVARSIKGHLKPDTLIFSIIAGVTTDVISEKMGVKHVIRAMPNTPSRIGMGISVWYQTPDVTPEQNELARDILQNLGNEVHVDDESYLDMATALSGTGPAYVFLFMEAMIDAGVHMGFPRRIAEELVIQTIRGSTEFYIQNHEHPARLRNDVTSPGGTSAEALYYLEKAGFRTALSRAVWAAYERSIELGKGINRNSSSGNNEKS